MKKQLKPASVDQPFRSLQSSTPTHAQISRLAYHLYVEGGYREGRALEDWVRAEQMLQNERVLDVSDTVPDAAQLSELKVRPFDEREYPLARGKRGSANRDEIRQQRVPPSPRQSLRRPTHSAQV